MIEEIEDFEWDAEPINIFLIRGHTVELITPSMAKITLKCPFPYEKDISQEHHTYAMELTTKIVDYMVYEQLVGDKTKLGVMIRTSHPDKKG